MLLTPNILTACGVLVLCYFCYSVCIYVALQILQASVIKIKSYLAVY